LSWRAGSTMSGSFQSALRLPPVPNTCSRRRPI